MHSKPENLIELLADLSRLKIRIADGGADVSIDGLDRLRAACELIKYFAEERLESVNEEEDYDLATGLYDLRRMSDQIHENIKKKHKSMGRVLMDSIRKDYDNLRILLGNVASLEDVDLLKMAELVLG